ncbi:MAG: L-threonylcarbamoyladenylate synthase [Bacteroidota bacterium]
MNTALLKARDVVLGGGVICYPTDTIWGLGCDATNETAVARIYEIKKRADNKSMLVLMDRVNRLDAYLREIPEIALQLIEVNDQPMTIIYSGAKNMAPNLIAPDGSVGIRVTTDPFCRRLIELIRRPLVSTSANFSGSPSPRYFGEISPELLKEVDYVAEWRQEETVPGKASSVIKIGPGGEIQILRK